jgi:hypothetical protein
MIATQSSYRGKNRRDKPGSASDAAGLYPSIAERPATIEKEVDALAAKETWSKSSRLAPLPEIAAEQCQAAPHS